MIFRTTFLFHKRNLIILLFTVLSQLGASVPDDYYTAANQLSGVELKAALYNIIKGHKEYSYTASSTDVWDILKESDRDTVNADNVILLYTGESVNAAQEYNSGSGWSREHVWAKSHGDFSTSKGAGTDAHHLRPADISVNSARNNKDFDDGGDRYYDNAGTIYTKCFSTTYTWEPREEVKGDVARMIFYMATRYNGDDGEPDLSISDDINTIEFCIDENNIGLIGKLSTLIEWHIQDTVDAFERNRNDVVYSYQNNRNPFIDHPEYVQSIWAGSASIPQSKSLDIEITTSVSSISVDYSNAMMTSIKVIDVGGKIVGQAGNVKSAEFPDLLPGVYIVQVLSNERIFVQKVVVSE